MSPRAPSKSKNTTTESRWTRLRRRLYRPTVLLVIGLLPMTVLLFAAVRRSLPRLESRPEYAVTAESVEVVDPPAWIPRSFVARTLDRAELPLPMSLLDESLVADLAGAFERSPWVADVEEVRKHADGRVVAKLVFREPVAVVRLDRVSYPVDAHGILLPAEDFDPQRAARLPTIVGIGTEPGSPGESWVDPVLAGAARLAEAIRRDWSRFGFDSIRLRFDESRGREATDLVYEIRTREGSLVVWGRAPGSNHPGELTVPQKLGKLTRYLEKFESFDKPNGPYEIDIRHWREITRQRIAVTPERTIR